MRPDLQREFNARVTDASYQKFRSELDTFLDMKIGYRVCEMPVFVSNVLREKLETAAVEMIEQCSSETNQRRSDATLEPRFTVPNQDSHPLFSVVDFGVTQDEAGEYQPKLIELQGFPSLMGYQYLFAQRMIDQYDIEGVTPFLGGQSADAYWEMVRSAIYSRTTPDECVLMEIDPLQQKTLSDFRALEHYIDLPFVNVRDVSVQNNRMFAEYRGSKREITRVFNRAIIDELDDLNVEMPFQWSDDIDVQWAGHPNWYFRISKFLLPYIKHDASPATHFLNTLDTIPDLSRYVLKPLYSFAGKGVVIFPTEKDIMVIPAKERSSWVLQEKVEYASCLPTPAGDNKVEIRVMLIWRPEDERPIPVMSMARTGRAEMMGARHNREPWTGSSGCLFV